MLTYGCEEHASVCWNRLISSWEPSYTCPNFVDTGRATFVGEVLLACASFEIPQSELEVGQTASWWRVGQCWRPSQHHASANHWRFTGWSQRHQKSDRGRWSRNIWWRVLVTFLIGGWTVSWFVKNKTKCSASVLFENGSSSSQTKYLPLKQQGMIISSNFNRPYMDFPYCILPTLD